MKISKTLIRVLIAFDICVIVGFYLWSRQPQSFFDDVKSYQSFAQIKSLPQLSNAKWRVTVDSDAEGNDQRPPFKIEDAETNYTHLGFRGKTKFQFYNDRLWQVSFQPSPASRILYMNALSKVTGAKLNTMGNARVKNMVYYGPSNLVAWTDERLSNEINAWIRRYS